jgi:CheY-like chemotaxis protein
MPDQILSESLILWAEDDDNDAFLVERAFRKAKLPVRLIRLRDGEEVVKYLTGQGCYSDRAKYPLPSILLLDLTMPGKTGLDVLRWKRSQTQWRNLPAVMLSASSEGCDRQAAEELGVNGYFIKPFKSSDMAKLSRILAGFEM